MKFMNSLPSNVWLRFVFIGMFHVITFSIILLLFCIVVQNIYDTYYLSSMWSIAKTWIIGIPSFLYVYVVTGKTIISCIERRPDGLPHNQLLSREKFHFSLSIISFLIGSILAMGILFKYSPTEDLARLMFFICPIAWGIFGLATFCSQVLSRKLQISEDHTS